jgi:Penicillin-Binding Protein C-terminus Family
VNLLLAAALLLQPVLADDGELRFVAVGVGAEPVTWVMDGVEVATTRDREAVSVGAAAGRHEVWAVSDARGPWRALVRPADPPPDGAVIVPAWTAVHEPTPDSGWPSWALPLAATVAAVAVLVRPRSLLQAARRRLRP